MSNLKEIEAKCHGCQRVLKVLFGPVSDPSSYKGTKLIPKLNAPFICGDCRLDKVKFKAARKAMELIIGPIGLKEGFDA